MLKSLIIQNKFRSGALACLVGFGVIGLFQNCSNGFKSSLLGQSYLASAGPEDILPPAVVPRFLGKLEDSAFVQSRSRFELMYAAQDLLKDPSIGIDFVKSLPVDPKVSGFESASTQHYDEAYMSARLAFAEKIAKKAIRTSAIFPCQMPLLHEVAFEGCPLTVLKDFAERAFRRPLTVVEQQNLKSLYEKNMQSATAEMDVAGRAAPTGYLDSVSTGLVAKGWTRDPDWPDRTVEVHFYVETSAGMEFVGNTFANQPRQDVNDHFTNQGLAYGGDHGYTFVLPQKFGDNQLRKLHAYAIGKAGGNPELGGSPMDFTATFVDKIMMSLPPILSSPVEEGLKAAMMYVMMSPAFQLRTVQSAELQTAKTNSYDLANRLALFLTGGVPDAQLLARAKDGSIHKSDVYEAEVRRLIATYSERFSANVIGQWMGYRDFSMMDGVTSLDRAMVRESQLVFKEIVDKNLTSESILKPGFTFVNSELAKHYGISDPGSANFTKVGDGERGGILAQGSLLRSTAPLNLTKPIVRGKWVSANILCRTIPPPSAELFQLIESSKKLADPNWSVSQKLENHRNSGAVCQSCHQYMDPLGLALENYGPFGLKRANYDDGKPVITSGELDGAPFTGVKDLVDIVERRDDFRECVVMKLMTHALSRPLSPEELYYVQKIKNESHGVADILVNIAKSPAFLKQREDL